MQDPSAQPNQNGTLEYCFEDIVAEISDKLHAGDAVNIDQYAGRYPQWAERLRELAPALQMMAQLGQGGGGNGSIAVSAGDHPEPDEVPLRGTLGDFRILREVGRGGMGVVYEAEQISLERRVALKVLPFAATMDPRHLQRFHNEARAAACLDHPHIVKVHAVGQDRGVHYYAMQFIEGQTLAQLIASQQASESKHAQKSGRSASEPAETVAYQGSAPPAADTAPVAAASTQSGPRDRSYFRRVAECGIDAAEALEHAHQLGIVHRDIKPGNLMIDAHGKLWVADFGLAQRGGDNGLTMTGSLLGTLRYMSPEQALAKRVVIDQRTDVYSLGATLYELMTLQPVFDGNDQQELLRQIAFEEPRPPRRLERAIPPELETIVLKALEKNPQDRYGTAQELADDLRRYLGDEPIRARRPGPIARARKWSRRHRALVNSAIATVVMAIVALAVGTALLAAAYDRETALRKEAQNQAELAEEQRDVADQYLYLAHMQLAQRVWEEGNANRTRELLDAHVPVAGRKDRRNWEWYHLDAMYHRGLRIKTRDPSSEFFADVTVTWDPSATRLFTSGPDRMVKIWDATTGEEHASFAVDNHGVFSPDCQRFVTAVASHYSIFDVAAGKVVHEFSAHNGSRGGFFSPLGQRLAMGGPRIRILDTNTYQEVQTIELQSRDSAETCIADGLSWSPDGRRLASVIVRGRGKDQAFTAADWVITVWDLATGKEMYTVSIDRPGGMAWSPDGSRLAVEKDNESRTQAQVLILNAADGKTVCTLYPAGEQQGWTLEKPITVPVAIGGRGLAWSTDGSYLALAAGRNIAVIDTATMAPKMVLAGHASGIASLAWCPDSPRLASIDSHGVLMAWDLLQELQYQVFRAPDLSIGCVDWNTVMSDCVGWQTDGKLWAWGKQGSESVLRTWNPATGQVSRSVPMGQLDLAHGRSLSPDGRLVIAYESPPAPAERLGPDGRKVVDPQGGGVRILVKIVDVATGQTCLDLGLHHGPSCEGRWSADGKRFALSFWGSKDVDGVYIFDMPTGSDISWVCQWPPPISVARYWDLSTDGSRLVSIGEGIGDNRVPVSIHDAHSGKGLHSWSIPASGFQTLSPDAHSIAVCIRNAEIQLYDLDTGDLQRTLRGHTGLAMCPTWSPDGRRLASVGLDRFVRIWDVDSGECVYSLRLDQRFAPQGAPSLFWSPDGKRLGYFPGANKDHPAPDVIIFDATKRGSWYPGIAATQNNLAWRLATCPDSQFRNPKRAVALSKQALDIAPEVGSYWRTLGAAEYRAGNWQGCTEALDKSMKLQEGGDPNDWFFLAMAQWQLGKKDDAQRWYKEAVEWMDKHNSKEVDLGRFRLETSELLGLKEESSK